MKLGTKSLLFGCHQVVLHPIFVYAAWVKCYKQLPNLKETICIVVHDWGYLHKENMDSPQGESHPEWAANCAWKFLDTNSTQGYYMRLCLYHSRFYARKDGQPISKLCLPDKVGVALMPNWLWVTLGKLSGELYEYMSQSKYEINQHMLANIGPSGKDFRTGTEFFKAYKAKAKEWFDNPETLSISKE